MSHKSGKIAELIAHLKGRGADPHYLGFFECFNRGWFYEAHDVLEELWLECRGSERDEFYKALIQLAGAFVHLQKDRLRPAGKLFRLSRSYLKKYPEEYANLSVRDVIELIDRWHGELEKADFGKNPLKSRPFPRLQPPAS